MLSNASSEISRTSPAVFRPAPNSAFFMRVGNRTSRIDMLSGSSGVGSISLICLSHSAGQLALLSGWQGMPEG